MGLLIGGERSVERLFIGVQQGLKKAETAAKNPLR